MSTLLDSNQVIQKSFDEPNKALRITAASGGLEVTASSPLPVTVSSADVLDVRASFSIDAVNLTTSYYEVTSSLVDDISKIAIYETTGQTIELATGPSGGETVKLRIGPGCDQVIDVNLPAGTRISVRTVGVNASAGGLILNCIGAI